MCDVSGADNLTTSWSLKYNLLYQYVLDLPLFPEARATIIRPSTHHTPQSFIALEELYYNEDQLNEFGVVRVQRPAVVCDVPQPLDDRATFTKTDWLSWIAAMGSQAQFNALFQAIYRFADQTPSRVPFSDWCAVL